MFQNRSLKSLGQVMRIKVPCRLCDRWFEVPNVNFLSVPRPLCDDCSELDGDVTLTDQDGWRL